MAAPTGADAIARLLAAMLGSAAFLVQAATPALSPAGINITADTQEASLREDVHVFSGNVRITQADMSIDADKATATNLQSDQGQVVFESKVHMRSAKADLHADAVDATFTKGQLTEALAKGTPASFEQLGTPSDKQIRGRANVIEYDLGKGTVKMSQNVWFSYGGNEVRGDTVIYNLNDERVVVNPGATSQSGGRVNITIKPGAVPALPGSSKPKNPDGAPDKGGSKE